MMYYMYTNLSVPVGVLQRYPPPKGDVRRATDIMVRSYVPGVGGSEKTRNKNIIYTLPGI